MINRFSFTKYWECVHNNIFVQLSIPSHLAHITQPINIKKYIINSLVIMLLLMIAIFFLSTICFDNIHTISQRYKSFKKVRYITVMYIIFSHDLYICEIFQAF